MSSSQRQRATRSLHQAGAAARADTTATTMTPPFSFSPGSSDGPTRPRSTRVAAVRASTRIARDAVPQRRSARTAAARGRGAGRSGPGASPPPPSSSPARRGVALSPATRARGTKGSPIVLDDDDDDDVDEMDLKPAAKPVGGGVVVELERPPADFTCAICLDAPASLSEVATISGCSHRFCFDCIDQWAETENKCPCCKERFRTIDRCAALPPDPSPTGRRPKRKRAPAAGGSSSSRRSARVRRVNSRTVEDRSQQSLTSFPINAAIVEQILASFSSYGGFRGTGQVTFSTSEDGRPAIRMIRPNGSGGMVGVMEMLLPEPLEGENGAAGAVAAGRSAGSPTRTARFRFGRALSSGSRRGPSASAGSGGVRASFSHAETSVPEDPGNGTAGASGRGVTARGRGSSPTRTARFRFGRARSSAGSRSSLPPAGIVPTPPAGGLSRVARANSARPASAAGSRAARQGASAFASLFANLGGGLASSAAGGPRRGAEPAADGAARSAAAGGETPSNRMTMIQFIARDPRDRSPGSGGRSGGRRVRRGSAGNQDDNEPIVID